MFFKTNPRLIVVEVPFSFKSLVSYMALLSLSMLPLASFTPMVSFL